MDSYSIGWSKRGNCWRNWVHKTTPSSIASSNEGKFDWLVTLLLFSHRQHWWARAMQRCVFQRIRSINLFEHRIVPTAIFRDTKNRNLCSLFEQLIRQILRAVSRSISFDAKNYCRCKFCRNWNKSWSRGQPVLFCFAIPFDPIFKWLHFSGTNYINKSFSLHIWSTESNIPVSILTELEALETRIISVRL